MSHPSLYFVYHTLGLPGTWATWFIDQHRNFSKSDIIMSSELPNSNEEFIPEYVEHPLHMNIPEYSLSLWQSNLSYKEYLNKQTSTELLLKDGRGFNEKVAIKFSHHHKASFLDLFEESTEDFISTLRIPDNNSIKLNIMLTVAEGLGPWTHMFADRIGDLKQVLTGEGQFGHTRNERNLQILSELAGQIQFLPELNKIAPVYCLNIDKLLEHDRKEYENLCRAIGEDPLENWEELIEPMDTIFSRYREEHDRFEEWQQQVKDKE